MEINAIDVVEKYKRLTTELQYKNLVLEAQVDSLQDENTRLKSSIQDNITKSE